MKRITPSNKLSRSFSSPTAAGGKVCANSGPKTSKTANNVTIRRTVPQKRG